MQSHLTMSIKERKGQLHGVTGFDLQVMAEVPCLFWLRWLSLQGQRDTHDKFQRAPCKSVWRFCVNTIHTAVYPSCLKNQIPVTVGKLGFFRLTFIPEKNKFLTKAILRRPLFFLPLMYSPKIYTDFREVFALGGAEAASGCFWISLVRVLTSRLLPS